VVDAGDAAVSGGWAREGGEAEFVTRETGGATDGLGARRRGGRTVVVVVSPAGSSAGTDAVAGAVEGELAAGAVVVVVCGGKVVVVVLLVKDSSSREASGGTSTGTPGGAVSVVTPVLGVLDVAPPTVWLTGLICGAAGSSPAATNRTPPAPTPRLTMPAAIRPNIGSTQRNPMQTS
jgi:hypothetical protein